MLLGADLGCPLDPGSGAPFWRRALESLTGRGRPTSKDGVRPSRKQLRVWRLPSCCLAGCRAGWGAGPTPWWWRSLEAVAGADPGCWWPSGRAWAVRESASFACCWAGGGCWAEAEISARLSVVSAPL